MLVGELLTLLKDRERQLRQDSDDAMYDCLVGMHRKHADDVRRAIQIVEDILIKETFRKVQEAK